MHILHVTTFLQGGAGRIIADLAMAQHRNGHDVRVVADAGGEPGYGHYPEYLEALAAAGIPAVLIRSTFKREAPLIESATARVRQMTAAYPPDVVHVHAGTPSVIARRANLHRAHAGARLVHTMHGWGINKTARQAADDLAALEQADIVTVPSRAAASALREIGLRRADVHVIPYGLPPGPRACDRPDPEDRALIDACRGGGQVALCIGTIGARKNQHLLVEALRLSGMERVVAVFVGDGDADGLRAHATQAGVADRTLVLGHRAHASRYLSIADVVVLPSRNEGLPITVLESLRAGVRVAAARIAEISEALGDDCGEWLFTPEDPASLVEAVRRALVTPRVPAAARLRHRFAQHYAQARMVASYDSVYGIPAPHRRESCAAMNAR